MRISAVITSLALFHQTGNCQAEENYANLPRGIVRSEVATFVRSAGGQIDKHVTPLVEIRLLRCSSDFVHFESGDWIALDKLVTITSTPVKENDSIPLYSKAWGISDRFPGTEISEVRFVHYKFPVTLPDIAIAGLFNPNFCVNPSKKNKVRRTTSSNCKVYQSQDAKRVYIYMLNGQGAGQYEVTWVLEDSKYSRRIIDKVL